MRAVVGVVALTALRMAQVVLAAVVLGVFLAAQMQRLALQIEVAVAEVVLMVVAQLAAMVVPVLSSSATQGHSAVLAARSHHPVVTLFIHSQLQGHIQHESLC
jgi:hypothetical protein